MPGRAEESWHPSASCALFATTARSAGHSTPHEMDALKGVADAVEQLIYEALGILVPGLAAVMAAMVLWLPHPHALRAFAWMEAHQVHVLVGAYVLGYAVQGIAHPLTRPLLRALSFRQTNRTAPPTNFREMARAYWGRKLRVETVAALDDPQVRDLSYSVLGTATRRLERFRAAEGLTRGVAAVCVLAFLALTVQLIAGWREWEAVAALPLFALLVVTAGLCERAARYDQLWSAVLESQFAATVLAEASAGMLAAPSVAPVGIALPSADQAVLPSATTRAALPPDAGPTLAPASARPALADDLPPSSASSR